VSSSLVGRDLLSVADLSSDELSEILDTAREAKSGGAVARTLEGCTLALIFQRPSNRTRVSFEVAIRRLGGAPTSLLNDEIRIGERESVGDIGRILDRYVDGIVARLVSHRDLEKMAAAVAVPVISAMSDAEHPCQILADLLTVRERCGALEGVPVAYVGDGNNVCASWCYGAALTGIDLRVVCPPGYEPPAAVIERAGRLAGGRVPLVTQDAEAALSGARIVYTDVWTSMGQESEQQRRREDFAHLQVNDALLARAAPDAWVMHCLPAHRGEEITDAVIDGPRSIIFDQAENRMWAQQSLLSLIYSGTGAHAGRGMLAKTALGRAE